MHPRNNLFFAFFASILLISISALAQNQGSNSQSQPQPTVFPSAQPAPQNPPAQNPSQPAAQPSTLPQSSQSPNQQQPSQQPAPQQPQQQPTTGTSDQLPPPRGTDTIQMPNKQQGQQGQTQDKGQAPTTGENGAYVFKTQVEEVVLYATVVDEKGHIVTDLPKSAFTVYENNIPQPITHLERKDVPVGLGIVIDNSGSMREKREKVNIAAVDLVKASNPDDRVFVVNFNDDYYLDQEFTSSIPKLQEALENIVQRGGTALYDAVLASDKYLEDSSDILKKQANIQKRVLFVVTDGVDNSSINSLEQTVRRLQNQNAPTIYTIGILDKEDRRKGMRALRALAEQTGGLAFFPKDANEVDEIARTVARDIRSQYVIVYKKPPASPGAPEYRQIKVVAKAPGYHNLQVRTLTGYFAGQERAAR
jgi:Ca-activated chloride channel family protein